MYGLVLHYDVERCSGLVWCEDQGPLAILHAQTVLPRGAQLMRGDGVRIRSVQDGSFRVVEEVTAILPGLAGADPAEMLRKARRAAQGADGDKTDWAAK